MSLNVHYFEICHLYIPVEIKNSLFYGILSFMRFKDMRFLKKRNRLTLLFSVWFTLFWINYKVTVRKEEGEYVLPLRLQKYMVDKGNLKENKTNIHNLKVLLTKLNLKQKIINGNKFPSIESDSPVMMIQVHKDLNKLQYLIISLSQVEDIENSLLIFSHSFYSNTINTLIESIDFCKVLQIFYPYSLQIHPHKFPGTDPEDCTSDDQMTKNYKNSSEKKFCAKRIATLTEHKQHWWWKANYVFQHLRWTQTHTGPVIFLEENNYVSPDLLTMLQYALKSLSYFPHAEVLSFGRPLTRNIDMDLLILEPWRPPFHIGLAFNVTTWRKIISLSDQYCMYDDNNWSYSLSNLFRSFPRGHVNMVGCATPRVINTKEFLHSLDIFKTYVYSFTHINEFPKKVKTVFLFGPQGIVERVDKSPPTGKGGWSDMRDQLLCLDPLLSTTTEA